MTLNVIRGNLFQIDNLIGTILNVEFSLYDIRYRLELIEL